MWVCMSAPVLHKIGKNKQTNKACLFVFKLDFVFYLLIFVAKL